MTQATKRQRKRARAKRHQKGATARNRQRGYTSSDLVRMFGALRTADGEKIAFSDKQLSMVHETMSTRDRSSFHTQATKRRLAKAAKPEPETKPKRKLIVEEVSVTPTEHEWEELKALAKKRKRGVAKMAEKKGWTPTGLDPKAREGWKRVVT